MGVFGAVAQSAPVSRSSRRRRKETRHPGRNASFTEASRRSDAGGTVETLALLAPPPDEVADLGSPGAAQEAVGVRSDADAGRAREGRSPVGAARWATLAGIAVFALVWSAYSVGAQNGSFLTQDFGAQYHLSEITAHGAVPLVDFQHGWNAGSWWVNAVLYTVASGSPTLWYFLWGRLLGAGLGAVVAALVGVRLRLHPAVMVAMALGVVLLATPLHIKYAMPLLFVLALLPTGWLESRPRLGAAVRILLPALLFWQYVELAVLLAGAAGLFELFGRRAVSWRTRLVNCCQLAGGFAFGLVAQALLFRLVWGLSFSSFNEQVVLGQAETAPTSQYAAWDFFALPTDSGRWLILALYPFALLLPFVPVMWARASDATRLVALAGLVCVVVPIRRVDNPHTTTVSALVLMAVVMAVADLYERRLGSLSGVPRSALTSPAEFDGGGDRSAGDPGERPAGDPARRALLAAAALLGAAWAVLTLWLGFGLQSMAGAVVLVALAVAGALSAHVLRRARVAASTGALLVLAGVPAAASLDHLDDMRKVAQPFANSDAIATAIRPEVSRCGAGTKQALVMPNYLELYGALGLTNPTPYYLFHYDIANHRADVTHRLTDGSVPMIIDTMPLHTPQPWLMRKIREQYVPCARVHITRLGMTVTVWTDQDRGAVQKRDVTLDPAGRRVVKQVR